MKNKRHFCGFTLIELLVTLTIIALVGAVVVPSYLASQKRARTDAAISRGAVLDIAKSNYLQAKGTDAWDAWDTIETTNAGNDDAINDAKYQALKSFLSSAESLLGVGTGNGNEYTPKGYKYELNGLSDSTTVIDLDSGNVVAGVDEGNGVRVKITRSTFEQDGTTPSSEVGGVISGVGLYELQSTATLVAYPRLGFEFVNWSLDGSSVGTANQLNIGPFASAGTLTYDAIFKRLPPGTFNLVVSSNPSLGGSVSVNPNKVSYTNGETVTLTATPAAGYTFDRWFGTGISFTSNPLTGVVMDQNRQVYANFVPPTFNVVMQNPDISGAGATTPSGGTTNKVLQGSSISISSVPNLGYDFSQWTGLPAGAPANTASQIITVNNNLTIKPVYVPSPTYNLSVNVTPSGYGTAIVGADPNTTSVSMVKGQSTNVSAFPGSGKLFEKWILASGNGTLSDLASPTTSFTMHPSAPAANNVVTAQFKDNQLASEVISVPPGMSYIKTTSNLASVGLTTPNNAVTPGSQVPVSAQVSSNFPNFRFIRWAKKPDTNTTISTAATFNVTAPAVGVIDEYVAYFDLGVNKFISEMPTTPYAPYNSILNPARDKIYSAVGLDGVIVQDATNTNAANITQLCQLKFPANTTCMATREDLGFAAFTQKWIAVGSTAAGQGIRFYEPPAYLKYNTADATNVTSPAILNANGVTFAARDLAFNRALDATSGTILYAVSSGQVAQFNFYPAANGEKDHWRKDYFFPSPGVEVAKSVAVQPITGNVYILYFNSLLNKHSIYCLNNKTNVSLGRTQIWTWPVGEVYNLIRFHPVNTSELHVIRGGAGFTTVNEISVLSVNGANPATQPKRYTYTQGGTGDPTQMVFTASGGHAIISGPTRTVSLADPGPPGNFTFNGAPNTSGGPYLTYAGAESSYGFPIGMIRNPLTGEIWSLAGPAASTLGHNGYALRYSLDGNGVIDTNTVKRAMIDARGLAFDRTGTYLYVTDYPYNTNHALGKLAIFDLAGNLKGWDSSVFLGTAWGISLDKKFSPANFWNRWYVVTDSTPAGGLQKFGIVPYITPGNLLTLSVQSGINTHDWTPANVFANSDTDKLWAVQFNGNEVAAFDLLNTNNYPRVSGFTLGSSGTGSVGIATPADGNELFVTFSGSGVSPKVGVYDPASGQQRRSLVFPFTGTTELQGIYYDDPATNVFISDHGDKRILKFGP